MGWTEGYASDVEYVAGYYAEQGPDLLSFACLLNGIEPVETAVPFTYCELGFGRGLTVSLLAAANPHARFYATDFNPSHVADARRTAERAGLRNLTLLENSFEELAAGEVADLPQFDFITLHGIYTWVNAEVRTQIVTFLKRYLKPGGTVYASYNAMPGWAASAPLQRLLYEHGQLHTGRADYKAQEAVKFAADLARHGRGCFANNVPFTSRLQSAQDASPSYLVHEYMHPHWQPLYHADVARQFSEAKLEFAGRAELLVNFTSLFMPADMARQIETVPDAAFRETLKDYAMNTNFRKDVFVRGAHRLTPAAQKNWMKRFQVAALVPHSKLRIEFASSFGTVQGRPELFEPLFAALSERPRTLYELIGLPHLTTQAAVLEAVAMLCGSLQAAVYQIREQPNPASAQRLNRTLAARAHVTEDMLGGLASPLTGGATPAALFEMLAYSGMAHAGLPADVEQLTVYACQVLTENGKELTRDGKAVTEADELHALVRKGIGEVVERLVPMWRQHGTL